MTDRNTLYYGDNLDVLRRYVPDGSVDLVYLDPPFNSNATYNVLFQEQDGSRAAAQVMAFGDTWRWDAAAAAAYHEVVVAGGKVSQVMQAFRAYLGESDMLAYLAMMAPRLVDLRRALRATGSIYLHCDPTASHYLKIVMDAVFGPENFLSEVVWKRTGTHSSARRWGPVHDTVLVFARSAGAHVWNRQFVPLDADHRARHYRHADARGRRYAHGELTAPGTRNGRSGVPWRGFDVAAIGRHWMTTVEKLDALHAAGRIYLPDDGGWPRLIRYDEGRGRAVGDVWSDIAPINMQARERLGYPTQKPTELLERVIAASSDPGGVVLDPFCGCGTTVAAAQKLGRRWVGIDVTHVSIGLIKNRLRTAFGPAVAADYAVVGEPVDLASARALAAHDKFQFQAWALGLVGARTVQVKRGADRGIDGQLDFHDEREGARAKKVLFSVKAGHAGVAHVRDLRGVIERERAAVGVMITMQEPTKAMRTEAAAAGYYQAPMGAKFPRLQLRTVEQLLGGAQIEMPGWHAPKTFRQAPRVKGKGHTQNALPFDGTPD